MSLGTAAGPSRLLHGLLVVLVLAFLVVLSVFPVNSNDVFLYLELGRRFVAGEGLPTTDVFRFSGTNAAFDCYHELGSMLVYYLAYAAGGFDALILVKCVLLLALGALPLWVAWKLGRQRYSTALPVLVFLAGYGASWRFIERGSLFSDLFSTLLVSLIVLIRANAGRVALYRAAIPLLFLVWVNVHAGYVVGFLILGVWLLAELTGCLLGDEAQRSAALSEFGAIAKTIAGSALLGLLNPRSVSSYAALAKILLETRWSATRATNPEFMSPLAKGFLEFLDTRVFVGVVLACLLLAAYTVARLASRRAWRELPVFEVLCLGVFAYLGFSMTRFVIAASFGALVLAAALLANTAVQPGRDDAPQRPPRLALPALAVLGVAVCIGAVALNGYGPPYATRRLGLGVDERDKPVRACEFIDKVDLRVNIFNRYEYGAYMVWKWRGARKVHVHGFTADADFVKNEYAGIELAPGEFTRIVSKYDIGAFLLQAPRQGSSSMPETFRRLMTDRQWHLVYADEVAALFVRDVPENREVIERYSPRHAQRRGG